MDNSVLAGRLRYIFCPLTDLGIFSSRKEKKSTKSKETAYSNAILTINEHEETEYFTTLLRINSVHLDNKKE